MNTNGLIESDLFDFLPSADFDRKNAIGTDIYWVCSFSFT